MGQGLLFDLEGSPSAPSERSGTFSDNMRLPVHRWFRYSAGFSAEWAGRVIQEAAGGGSLRVLDPFAGSGTVVLEAERAGAEAIGVEAHPFVARIARAKLFWRADPKKLRMRGAALVAAARTRDGTSEGYAPLIGKCFPREALEGLDSIRRAWGEVRDDSPESELCWLALVSILRAVSPVGTAQWQYILPRKSKAKALQPLDALEAKIATMASDMATWQSDALRPKGRIVEQDARECADVEDGWADLVLTSPPYANNYDYADATRLEMTFFGEVRGWGDLQGSVRDRLVRSCTQHVAPIAVRARLTVQDPVLAPIADDLAATCARLDLEKERHGGKKPYHAMIAYYFHDLARVWLALRRAVRPGGRACFVVGDLAPYGIYVPVDRWLGELALHAGFRGYRFEKLRDRNTKWKNRKHRVPLHEGLLWVEG